MTLTPEEQERQKKLEEDSAKRAAEINEWWIKDKLRWEKWVRSVKERIAVIDGIDPETASPELLPTLGKLESTLRSLSDLSTKPKE